MIIVIQWEEKRNEITVSVSGIFGPSLKISIHVALNIFVKLEHPSFGKQPIHYDKCLHISQIYYLTSSKLYSIRYDICKISMFISCVV